MPLRSFYDVHSLPLKDRRIHRGAKQFLTERRSRRLKRRGQFGQDLEPFSTRAAVLLSISRFRGSALNLNSPVLSRETFQWRSKWRSPQSSPGFSNDVWCDLSSYGGLTRA